MHFKNALNAFIYTVFRAFFTQSLAKFRIIDDTLFSAVCQLKITNSQQHTMADLSSIPVLCNPT